MSSSEANEAGSAAILGLMRRASRERLPTGEQVYLTNAEYVDTEEPLADQL